MDKINTKIFMDLLEQEEILFNPSGINEMETFSENGIDSLDLFAVLLKIEDALGVKVPDEDLNEIETPKALFDYINSK